MAQPTRAIEQASSCFLPSESAGPLVIQLRTSPPDILATSPVAGAFPGAAAYPLTPFDDLSPLPRLPSALDATLPTAPTRSVPTVRYVYQLRLCIHTPLSPARCV